MFKYVRTVRFTVTARCIENVNLGEVAKFSKWGKYNDEFHISIFPENGRARIENGGGSAIPICHW